jgi:xylan 1,4-beta-xylosidase
VLTLQGVTKPTFHGFRRLHVLGDGLVAEIPAGVVTRRSTDGRVAGLFFHYPPEEPQTVPASFGARDDADADGVLVVRTTLRPWAVASLVEELAPGSR